MEIKLVKSTLLRNVEVEQMDNQANGSETLGSAYSRGVYTAKNK